MALLLYAATAALLLWLTHRYVLPLTPAAAALLFLIPFLFTGYALLTSRVYAPVDHAWDFVPLNWMKEDYGLVAAHNGYLSDVATQMIPWRAAVRGALAHGEWPLWNRFLLAGDILAPAAQPAPFSPFTLLACLLPPALSMTFTAAIAHLVAALGAFLLARSLGCREAAALIAAAGFTYATSMALFILWPLGFAWAFAPLVFTGVRRRSLPLLTVAFVLLLLAGHPETALHVVFLAAIYALITVPPRALPRLALAGVLALLLTAFFIMPILEAAPQTHEHERRNAIFAKIPRGAEPRDALARLATDAFPYLHTRLPDVPIDTAAVGSIILALALYGAIRVRSRESWFFAGMAVFCLLARAEWKPIARALQKLPLFDQALNERFSFGAALALAILAALGVEELFRRDRDRVAAIVLVITFVVLAAGNAWLLRNVQAPAAWGKYKIAAELIGLALAIALLRKPQFLIAAVLLQRVVSDGGIYRAHEQKLAYPPIPILQAIPRQPIEPFRITGHGRAFIPGISALYELEDVRGYQAMTFRRTFETYPLWCVHQPVWFNRVDDLTRPFLSFLNVRYAITWDRDPPPPGWREVARQRGSLLLENTRVLGRAFVPGRVRIGHDALSEMAAEQDFGARAWIEAPLPPQERANGPGRVVTRNARLGYELDVRMEDDGWVVVSLPAWRGWRAYVDGRRVETRFANHAFLGVHVPRGTHRVRLVFLPTSFVVGGAISFATIMWSAATASRRFLYRRRARQLDAAAMDSGDSSSPHSTSLHRRQAFLEAGDSARAALPLGQ
ncbi:MAG: YfhO family protein [Thermoanaerobaculia bacterium]